MKPTSQLFSLYLLYTIHSFFPTRYKNFREVFSGRHYKISVEGTKYTLIIKKTEESDISGIQVSAKNKLGSASSRANLNVEGNVR